MKQHTSKVYGVWFYYLPPDQGILDDAWDFFPPGNDTRLVDYIPQKVREGKVPFVDEKLMKKRGCNVIAIGRGDHFDIYDYR